MSQLRILAVNPPGLDGPAVAVSAARCGFDGCLVLDFLAPQKAREALADLVAADVPFWIGCTQIDRDMQELLKPVVGRGLTTVLLTAAPVRNLKRDIKWLRDAGLTPVVEVISVVEAREAAKAGAAALVLKGREAGGYVGDVTSFILAQSILPDSTLPVWVRGGIGIHSAAALRAAGAAGIVLDWQLGLAFESDLPHTVRARLRTLSGGDTAVLTPVIGGPGWRAYGFVGETNFDSLADRAAQLRTQDRPAPEAVKEFHTEAARCAALEQDGDRLLLLSQDAALALPYAQRFRTVAGICRGVRREAERLGKLAARQQALRPGSPLAEALKTNYPILAAPIPGLSESVAFAAQVAAAGALPVLSLDGRNASDATLLLVDARSKLGDRPFGVALGCDAHGVTDPLLAVVQNAKPAAVILGSARPDAIAALEKTGIKTFARVQSAATARACINAGTKRLVLEGCEAGGLVGASGSFALWDACVAALSEKIQKDGLRGEDFSVFLAGGIHDSLSAAMAAGAASALVELGVRIGVQVGTGYLFTREAVECGALDKTAQQAALACESTILRELDNGRGRRVSQLRSTSGAKKGDSAELSIGQCAALRDEIVAIDSLHQDLSQGACDRLLAISPPSEPVVEKPSDIAIVGMASLMPKANNLQQYWENILNKVNAITEVPGERWNWKTYFDPDRMKRDTVYSRWGGFVDAIPFDPTKYGMPPNAVPSVEPLQLLALEIVRHALTDAGYGTKPFERARTCAIFGAGGGVSDLGNAYGFRSLLPYYMEKAGGGFADAARFIDGLEGELPEWTEDSFAGLLLNVAAGRVANRFDFGGTNFTVDAACASSLAAVRLAVQELETNSADVAVVGGVDTMQNPFTYLCFSKTQALSPTGTCKTFDAGADGIVTSEGLCILVLKRLADAERDGDRIYAVIKSVGTSSDGKHKGLTAPRPEGQVTAMERAYKKAGFSPGTLGLVEAHGTGTVAGDKSEIESVSMLLRLAGVPQGQVPVGSVKSLVGHAKCTAGVAGVVKAALALHHKVLPGTANVKNPNAAIAKSSLYVNTETRPWIARADGAPRRAGVSSFGFGGTNFHAVLEEYCPAGGVDELPASKTWPGELFAWRTGSVAEIVASIDALERAFVNGAAPRLADLAAAVCARHGRGNGSHCLALVASSLDDLKKKLVDVKQLLARAGGDISDPRGIYYSSQPRAAEGKVAFLFSGQGSQKVNMLRDLAVHYPGVRGVFEDADQALGDTLGKPLSRFVFPPPVFNEADGAVHEEALTQTRIAQPALGAADLAIFRILTELGIEPDMAGGHSYGEYAALCAAGVLRFADLIRISEARGRLIAEAGAKNPGTMAAIEGDEARVKELVAGVEGVEIANLNSPSQTVITGTLAGVEEALRKCSAAGVSGKRIKVSAAFHSSLVADACKPFAEVLDGARFKSPRFPVFSNTTARPHASDGAAIRSQLVEHLVKPVRFIDELLAMHDAGARVFVEIGPGRTLATLAERCLTGRTFVALTLDASGKHGLAALTTGLAQLHAAGVRFDLARVFDKRLEKTLDLDRLVEQSRPAPLTPTTFMLNGFSAIPLAGKPKKVKATVQEPPVMVALPAAASVTNQPAANAAPASVSPNGQNAGPTGSAIPTNPVPRTAEVRGGVSPVAAPAANAGGAASQPTARPQPAASAAPRARHPATGGSGMSSRPTASPAPPAGGGGVVYGTGVDAVMSGYQQLMLRFLETQRSVMVAYLQGGAAGASAQSMQELPAWTEPARVLPSPEPVARSVPSRVAAPAPAPAPVAQVVHAPAPVAVIAQPAPAPVVVAPAPVAQAPAPAPMAAAPAKAPSAPSGGGVSRERLIEHLVKVVSDRTGYPPDMLDLNLDLEADLGIDSIKRVEILGTLQKENAIPGGEAAAGQLEELSKLKTLNAIVEFIVSRAGAGGSGSNGNGKHQGSEVALSHPSEPRTVAVSPSADEVNVPRMVLTAGDRPFECVGGAPSLQGAVLITDDGRGIAQALAQRLTASGIAAVVMTALRDGEQPAANRVALQDRAAVAAAVEHLKVQTGRIAALVHLAPMSDDTNIARLSPPGWRSSLNVELHGLLHLSQLLESDLRAVGDGRLLVGTCLGGGFAALADAGAALPIHGGVIGFTKAVAREWSEVRCRAVDFATGMSAEQIALALFNELCDDTAALELGHVNGQRCTVQTKNESVAGRPATIELDESSVVMITGGARGVTAEVAVELAQQYRPTLVLVGRSPLPAETEEADTAGLEAAKDVKAALMKRITAAGQKATPAVIEQQYKRLLADRDIRQSVAAMKNAGAKLVYYSVDVSDPAKFGAVIDDVYAKFGKIDGVVHGAGVTEDKFLRDKTLESFERVVSPKVDGAFILASKLRPETLKFMFFFSSVSARYGNRGQSDYAAANEVLNKLAQWLNARWPGRIGSMNWGPWESSGGMVSKELGEQFAKAGVVMISRPAGRKLFVNEMRFGRKNEVEIVFGGPLSGADLNALFGGKEGAKPTAAPAAPATQAVPAAQTSRIILPLLSTGSQMQHLPDGTFEVLRRMDTTQDLYLLDHQLDGKPVLPAAMVLELAAEVALAGFPEWVLLGARELRVLNGIVLDGGAGTLRITAKPRVRKADGLELEVRVETPGPKPRFHYTVTIDMCATPPVPFAAPALTLANAKPMPITVDEGYDKYLFHGPLFAGIERVDAMGDNGMTALFSASSPLRCLAKTPDNSQWLIDPVMVDSALQLTILWSRLYQDLTPLPSRFTRYIRLGAPKQNNIRCDMHIRAADGPAFHADFAFCNADGSLFGWLEDMELTRSKSLNRLAGKVLNAKGGGA